MAGMMFSCLMGYSSCGEVVEFPNEQFAGAEFALAGKSSGLHIR
jgi:hypothetical protein